MNKIFGFLKSKLIDIKIYIARTMGWIGMANSLMLVFLVVERLNKLGVVKTDLSNSIVFVVIAWFLILVFLGWVEIKKIKAPHMESKKMLELNPPMKNAYKKIDEIDKRTKDIEEQLKKVKKL